MASICSVKYYNFVYIVSKNLKGTTCWSRVKSGTILLSSENLGLLKSLLWINPRGSLCLRDPVVFRVYYQEECILTLHPVAIYLERTKPQWTAAPLLLHRIYTAAPFPFTLHTDDRPWTSSVLHTETSLVYSTLTTHPHRLWPPSQCFVCSVGLRQPPPLHPSVAWVSLSPACHCHRSHLRIPMYCCRWRTPQVLG